MQVTLCWIHSGKKYVAVYGHWIDRKIEIESVKVLVAAEPIRAKRPTHRIIVQNLALENRDHVHSGQKDNG